MEISCKSPGISQKMKKVRITVLRKEFYPEYADEYLTEGQSVVRALYSRLGMNLFLRAARKCRRDFVRGLD